MFLTWITLRSGRKVIRCAARAIGVSTRHPHQAFRDPDSVGELNLDEDEFPVGLTHKIKVAATATGVGICQDPQTLSQPKDTNKGY